MEQQLRPHQQEAIDAVMTALDQNKKKILVEMVTGSGKFVVFDAVLAEIIRRHGSDSVRVLVDRKAVVEQIWQQFRKSNNKIAYGNHENDYPLVSTFQGFKSESRTLEGMKIKARNIKFLFLLDTKLSHEDIGLFLQYEKISNSNITFIALINSVSETYVSYFGNSVYSFNNRKAVSEGVRLPALIKYTVEEGAAPINSRLYVAQMIERVVHEIERVGKRRTVIYCNNLDMVNQVCEVLEQVTNIKVFTFLSTTPEYERKRALFDLKFHTQFFLVALNMSPQSFDSFGLTDVIILKKINSGLLFHEIVSLVTRPAENKEAGHVWDFGGNYDFYIESDEYGVELINANVGQYIADIPVETTSNDDSDTDQDVVNENEHDDASQVDTVKQKEKIKQKRVSPTGDNVTDEDLLDRGPLVHVISGIIEKIDTKTFRPFVIALMGKWGTGKSTVIKLIKKSLKKKSEYKFITFNAWQNEHCNNMAAALATTVVSEIFDKKNIIIQIWYIIKYHLCLKFRTEKAFVFLLALYLIYGFLTITPEDISKIVDLKSLQSIFGTGMAIKVGFIIVLIGVIVRCLSNPFTKRLRAMVSRPNYAEHLGVSDQIKADLTALINADSVTLCGKNMYQYVIVIDDLDRCSDGKIFEVLETIRLIVDLENIIVILAVDQAILQAAMANRFQKQNSHIQWPQALKLGRDFLGKIIQLSIELDTPHPASMKRFISRRLFNDEQKEAVISAKIEAGRKQPVPDSETTDAPVSADATTVSADTDLFSTDFDYFEQDEYEAHEATDEYLESDANEIEFFSTCVGVFNINNPRTLVRIHNTITLLKGVYPELLHNPEQLKTHVYFSFLHEIYSDLSKTEQEGIGKLHTELDDDSLFVKHIKQLAKQLKLDETDWAEQAKIYKRVRKHSLPGTKALLEHSRQTEQESGK
ncbi:MAG: P-loop NTPase fold protein [Gammaproteobacteria bacterium]|nr:P-loop NTPase fold protein [Gammaproteobacteria bacterium]MDH5653180.1 P-loop NTPase fold protein [Gammaproteobacteria bacterium]